jgi:hypothetical protein
MYAESTKVWRSNNSSLDNQMHEQACVKDWVKANLINSGSAYNRWKSVTTK